MEIMPRPKSNKPRKKENMLTCTLFFWNGYLAKKQSATTMAQPSKSEFMVVVSHREYTNLLFNS